MIAVEVADKNPRDARGSDIGKNKLPLRTFSGIKEESFVIPS
jgi:hypothetical protein